MKTIIAHLHDKQALPGSFISSLNEGFNARGLSEPDLPGTPEELLQKLDEYKEEEIMLFTNFPPNISYPEGGRFVKRQKTNKSMNRWSEADYYNLSYRLFNSFLKKYNFVAIHFITGAFEELISDSFLESALEDSSITITRKMDLFGKGIDNWTSYLSLILSKVL